MLPLDQLKEKINLALQYAQDDNPEKFTEVDNELLQVARMYSQQISNFMPESYNFISLQMNTLKYNLFAVGVALLIFGGAAYLTLTFVHVPALQVLIGFFIGGGLLKYGWSKTDELNKMYDDFKAMSSHNSHLRRAIANSIKGLHYLKSYEAEVGPAIATWKYQGRYTEPQQLSSQDKLFELFKNMDLGGKNDDDSTEEEKEERNSDDK